jgi:hypothetical protein
MLRETRAGIDALLRLLPEFGALAPGPDDPTTLFDRFGALLAHLGTEHPLLWLIDDLHWADRSTRELLGFLARTLRACRVLVVAAYRAESEPAPRRHTVLAACVAQLAAELGDGGWPDAVVAWQAVRQPYLMAYAQLRAAQVALAEGDRDTARHQLLLAAPLSRLVMMSTAPDATGSALDRESRRPPHPRSTSTSPRPVRTTE